MAVVAAVLACAAAAGLLAGLARVAVAELRSGCAARVARRPSPRRSERIPASPDTSARASTRPDSPGWRSPSRSPSCWAEWSRVGALLEMVRHNAGLARYDLAAARWGGKHATNGSTQVLRDISLLGGTYVMIVVALLAAVTQYLRTRTRAVVGFLAIVVVGQVLVTNLTKVLVDRARPDIHRLTGFSGSSFPSGHAATAAATFAAVALLVGRGRSRPNQGPPRRGRRGHRRRRRRDACPARRALAHRRDRRTRDRLGLVRDRVDRVRRSRAPIRPARRDRRTKRGMRRGRNPGRRTPAAQQRRASLTPRGTCRSDDDRPARW